MKLPKNRRQIFN